MARFRKRPIVIDAEQYHILCDSPSPDGVCWCENMSTGQPHIHTLEGPLIVSDGDWIITGIKGEKYPCKPDIFHATYELVTD